MRGEMPHKDPERARAYQREYREANAARKRELRLAHLYAITVELYNEMLEQQGGVCAICRGEETRTVKGTICSLAVDHDHETGRVRGLLCQACNAALGGFRDDPALLERAADYLKEGSNAQS